MCLKKTKTDKLKKDGKGRGKAQSQKNDAHSPTYRKEERVF